MNRRKFITYRDIIRNFAGDNQITMQIYQSRQRIGGKVLKAGHIWILEQNVISKALRGSKRWHGQ